MGFRIARELDAMGKRSDSGKAWCVSSINYILFNPVYTGRGIANRRTSAVYHKRSKNSPVKVQSDRASSQDGGPPGGRGWLLSGDRAQFHRSVRHAVVSRIFEISYGRT
jgi:hypothetical protein